MNIRVSQVVYLGRDCAKHEKKKHQRPTFERPTDLLSPFYQRRKFPGEEEEERGSVSFGGHSQAGRGIGRDVAVAWLPHFICAKTENTAGLISASA